MALTREFLERARRVALGGRAEPSRAGARAWRRAYAEAFGEFTTAALPGECTAKGRPPGNGDAGPVPARRKWWEDEL